MKLLNRVNHRRSWCPSNELLHVHYHVCNFRGSADARIAHMFKFGSWQSQIFSAFLFTCQEFLLQQIPRNITLHSLFVQTEHFGIMIFRLKCYKFLFNFSRRVKMRRRDFDTPTLNRNDSFFLMFLLHGSEYHEYIVDHFTNTLSPILKNEFISLC